MTLVESLTGAPTVRAVRPSRLATFAVSLVALFCFLYIAQHVIDAGYIRRDIAALEQGEAWRTGGWLSQLVLALVGVVGDRTIRQIVLSLFAAIAAGLLFGVLYYRLRRNGWFAIGAVLLLVGLGLHALTLHSISAGSRSLPLYVALAAMIPAIRSIEDVGDVQSAIGLGLLMPLLLLAGPATAPLILPFAIFAALADRDGRRDPRAFFAMLLVAVLPTIIVAIGIVGFTIQARLDLIGLLLPYLPAYGAIGLGDWQGALMRLLVYAPVMLLPILYCFASELPERRHVWSALAVIVLPLYLAIGSAVFPWDLPRPVPAMAVLATFASWLAVVRLPVSMRVAALLLLFAAAGASWLQTVHWDDPEWRAALFSGLPFLASGA